jgi:hypothetical protein
MVQDYTCYLIPSNAVVAESKCSTLLMPNPASLPLDTVLANTVVKLLALLSHIQEVPGEILAQRPAILSEFFFVGGFPQFLQADARIVFEIRPHAIQFINRAPFDASPSC